MAAARAARRAGMGGEGGFSLIEVMVAMMILMVASLGIVGMLGAGAAVTLTAKKADDARLEARQRLDGIKAMTYEDAKSTYPEGVWTPVKDGGVDPKRNGQTFQVEVYREAVTKAWNPLPVGTYCETCAGSTFAGFKYKVRVQAGTTGSNFNQTVSTVKMKSGSTKIDGISEDF